MVWTDRTGLFVSDEDCFAIYDQVVQFFVVFSVFDYKKHIIT